MPIQINRQQTARMEAQFRAALEQIQNEFLGLDSQRQYFNSFARLLKPDPLGRVLMLGTDQRDMFVPELRQLVARSVPAGGRIFDFGAGNGQTFALVADSVPAGTRISIEEPNSEYANAYRQFLEDHPTLHPEVCVHAPFDEMEEFAKREGINLPSDGTVDLALAMQMLFFVRDLRVGLLRMLRFLKPGGTLFVVLADEVDGFTGVALKSFINAGGTTGNDVSHLEAIELRRTLLGCQSHGGGLFAETAAEHDMVVEIKATRQPSRLYGHNLSDLIALANITVLSEVEDANKFEQVACLLRQSPEVVDLRIETEGPREGMWSVSQPQWVTTIHRLC